MVKLFSEDFPTPKLTTPTNSWSQDENNPTQLVILIIPDISSYTGVQCLKEHSDTGQTAVSVNWKIDINISSMFVVELVRE